MDISEPLYEDERLKVTYLHSPEKRDEIVSTEDHELFIREEESGEWVSYIIQRGILRELAETAKRSLGDLSNMLDNLNPLIQSKLIEERIFLREAGQAFARAYQKQEESFERYLDEQR